MKINTALILCAGLGKRLNPLTLTTPKPLLELNNVTMLENCINMLIKLGVKKVFLNTFHLSKQIFEFIKKKNFSIDIQIIRDGEMILDTGGGILNKALSFDKSLKGDFSIKDNLLKKNDNKNFIYIGCQILNRNIFNKYDINTFSITKVWNELLDKNELYGFESSNKFYHLTNFETFKKLQDL